MNRANPSGPPYVACVAYGQDAVVPPVAGAGERVHGHHLDDGDTEIDQPLKVTDGGIEGAVGRERADVQLVDDGVGEFDAAPILVVPLEAVDVDDGGAFVHAVGLCPRCRIRKRRRSVDGDRVSVTVTDVVDDTDPGGRARIVVVDDGDEVDAPVVEHDFDAFGVRRPHLEPRPAAGDGGSQ